MSYAASLQRRLRDNRMRSKAASAQAAPQSDPSVPFLHPARYPVHPGDKGQVHGGTCNVTACNRTRAVFWNRGTFGFYCPCCAQGINSGPGGRPPLCVLVEAKPDLAEMDRMNREMMDEMSA